MSDFDPYLKWLGIRDPKRPPNHYRLLGLELFEEDTEVIAGAADRQMAHVRTFQLGPHGELSQRILGELAEARRSLLDDNTRAAYNQSLTAALNQEAMLPPTQTDASSVSADPAAPVVPVAEPVSPRIRPMEPVVSPGAGTQSGRPAIRPSKPKKVRSTQRALMMLFGWIGGGVAALGVGYWLLNSEWFNQKIQPNQTANQQSDPTVDPNKSQTNNVNPSNNNGVKNNSNGNNGNQSQNKNITNGKPKTDPSTQTNSNQVNRSAPWEKRDWPKPPSHWLDPKNEVDQILQPLRFALGQRQYELARKQWSMVRGDVQRLNPDLLMGIWARDSEEFFERASKEARKLKMGDTLYYRGVPVRVEKRPRKDLTLSFDKGRKRRTFEISPERINRDLAESLLVSRNLYSEKQINRILAGDFSHYRFPELIAQKSTSSTSTVTGDAPWDQAKWREPPSYLTNPRTDYDRLVQRTRIAISQRKFSEAKAEWGKIATDAMKLEPKQDLNKQLVDMFEVFAVANQTARKLKSGDQFKFMDEDVTVIQQEKSKLRVKAGKYESEFDLRPNLINQHLALSLAVHSGQFKPEDAYQALAVDFLHIDLSDTKVPEFFTKPNPGSNSTTQSTNSSTASTESDPKNSNGTAETKKLPVPTEEEINEAIREVKSLYGEAYDKSKGYPRMLASIQSMSNGAISTNDTAMKYAMLVESNKLSSLLGEAKVAFESIDSLDRAFDVDHWANAKRTVNDVSKKAKSPIQIHDMYLGLIQLVKRAIKDHQFDAAVLFASKATTAAKKLDEQTYDETVALRNDVREMAKLFERAETGKTDLVVDDQNPDAHLAVGNFECLVDNDFESAFESWSKSSDDKRKLLARLEQENAESTQPTRLLEVANAWFEQGKNLRTFEDKQLVRRARFWFQKVVQNGEGAEKKEAESKLESTKTLADASELPLEPFFDNRWAFSIDGDQFEAQFFRRGRVVIQKGVMRELFKWSKTRKEYRFLFPQDNTIFVFEPTVRGDTVSFRKITIRNGRERVLTGGFGRPVGDP